MIVTIDLNMKLLPLDRAELEEILERVLNENNVKFAITGGGTLTDKNGEIDRCEIEITLDDEENYSKFLDLIKKFKLARGSKVISEKETVEIGNLEGFAIYLNCIDLSKEVYENCDINYVIEKLVEAMDGKGCIYSHYEGQKEIALYFYGESFNLMKSLTKEFISIYPLCEKCRIVQIA